MIAQKLLPLQRKPKRKRALLRSNSPAISFRITLK